MGRFSITRGTSLSPIKEGHLKRSFSRRLKKIPSFLQRRRGMPESKETQLQDRVRNCSSHGNSKMIRKTALLSDVRHSHRRKKRLHRNLLRRFESHSDTKSRNDSSGDNSDGDAESEDIVLDKKDKSECISENLKCEAEKTSLKRQIAKSLTRTFSQRSKAAKKHFLGKHMQLSGKSVLSGISVAMTTDKDTPLGSSGTQDLLSSETDHRTVSMCLTTGCSGQSAMLDLTNLVNLRPYDKAGKQGKRGLVKTNGGASLISSVSKRTSLPDGTCKTVNKFKSLDSQESYSAESADNEFSSEPIPWDSLIPAKYCKSSGTAKADGKTVSSADNEGAQKASLKVTKIGQKNLSDEQSAESSYQCVDSGENIWIKRSDSVNSVHSDNSFSSSVHSVKSTDLLFSSDSEEETDTSVTIPTETDHSFQAELKFLKSRDSVSDRSPIHRTVSLGSVDIVLDRSPEVESPGSVFLDHPMSIKYDQQMAVTSTPIKSPPVKGGSFESPFTKSSTKKANKRRSLDSSLSSVKVEPFKGHKLSSKTDPGKETGTDGISNTLSPVIEIGAVDTSPRHKSEANYYTLPNPRKQRSKPPTSRVRRHPTISSISKKLSEAQSLTNLKIGASIKAISMEVSDISKAGFSKTRSLSNLMSRKGIAVASSLSSFIRGRSNSSSSSTKKPSHKRRKKDEGSVLVYELSKVIVPKKLHASGRRRKSYAIDLNVAPVPIQSQFDVEDKRERKNLSSSGSSDSSVCPRSPVLLDEIMKSVDVRRLRPTCLVGSSSLVPNGALSISTDSSELGSSSPSNSSKAYLSKHHSESSDIVDMNVSRDKLFMTFCGICGKVQYSYTRNSIDLTNVGVPWKRKATSLCDLTTECACERRNFRSPLYDTQQSFQSREDLSSEDLDHVSPRSDELYKSPKRHSSMIEICMSPESTDDSVIDFRCRLGSGVEKSRKKSLLRHKPVLDLSVDDIDKAVAADKTVTTRSRKESNRSLKVRSVVSTCSGENFSEPWVDSIPRFHSQELLDDVRGECHSLTTKDSPAVDGIDGYCRNYSLPDMLSTNDFVHPDNEGRHDRDSVKGKVGDANNSFDKTSQRSDSLDLNSNEKGKQSTDKKSGFCSSCGSVLTAVEASTAENTGTHADCDTDRGHVEYAGNQGYRCCTQCQYKGKTTNGKVVPFRGRLERLATVEYDESLGFEVNTDSLNESSKSNGDLKTETGHMVTCNECQTGSLDSCDKQYDKCDKCKRTIPLTGSLELCNKQWDNCDKCKRTIPLNSVTKDGTNVGVERERPLCPECQKNVHNFKKSLPVTMVTSFCDSDEDLQKQEKRKHFSPKPSFPADAKHFLFSEHDIKALSDTNINKDHDTTGSKMEKNNVTLIQKTVCSRFSRWGSVDKLTTKVTDKPHVKFTSKTRSWSMSFRELSPFASLLQKQQKASFVSQMPRSPSYITSAHKLKHKYTSSKSQDSLNSISEDELLHKLPPLRRDLAGCGGGEMEEVLMYDVCLGYLVHSITCDNVTVCVYSLQRNKQLMEGVISPGGVPGSKPSPPPVPNKQNHQSKNKMDDLPNPAAPITVIPSEKLSRAGQVLRTILLSRAPHMIRDRKFHLRTYRRCMVGTEMVDWLLQQSSLVHSRNQAVGMWQALVEEGVIVHVCHEHQFKDKYLFYRFHEDDQGVSTVPSSVSKKECEDELQDTLLMLAQTGPDAMMRMILRKLPHERTMEDLEIIYEELLHIKALSHLSTMVKRELASVLVFESHAKAGTVLFNQGDEGKSWYIILKGSVNVVIYGKGVVCSLHEGDDFGKLALVNDAPRAATIVLRDDNCHFLRVDKEDFNRILRDVEANTVRLKEHGQDVLVLEKIPSNVQAADGTVQAHYKYSIMAGTPEKMLEHLLETRMDNKAEEESDGFLEDFLLTHVIFMPCNHLCPVLLSHYHSARSDSTEQEAHDFMLNHKRCVLHFVQEWATIVRAAFREDHTINAFLEELNSCVLEDLKTYPALKHELSMLNNILQNNDTSSSDEKKKKKSVTGSSSLSRKTSKENLLDGPKKRRPIKTSDENIFKVYCADHTYSTLRLPMDSTVVQIIDSAKDKLCLGEDLVLCEVKSTGERLPFKEIDLCVTSGLSFNGRLFITPREHLDALTPLPEQEGPPSGTMATIEMVSSRDMAYYMTLYDWELFMCVQEYELIYQVFGRYKFRKITANLDLFLRRFNEVQFWVVTEMVLTTNLSKRVTLLRKFIKLAAHCKENQNLNAFFAIVMGLSNIAVSRLSLTWEKLPGKFKKMFADFETLMDPSRNHRVYRLSVAKMVPPIIPFMPLLMKDMTFTHEGNKTYFDGLVNFEKMHMIAQTLKTVRFCRSHGLDLEAPGSMKSNDIANYIRNLEVIDNQRLLTQLSHKLEPRKT